MQAISNFGTSSCSYIITYTSLVSAAVGGVCFCPVGTVKLQGLDKPPLALFQVLAGCHSWWLMARPNSSIFIRFSDFGLSWNASRLAWHSHTHRDSSPRRKACNDDFNLFQFLRLEETTAHIQCWGGFRRYIEGTCTLPPFAHLARKNLIAGQPEDCQQIPHIQGGGRHFLKLFSLMDCGLYRKQQCDHCRRAASERSCPPRRCVPGCQSDRVRKLSGHGTRFSSIPVGLSHWVHFPIGTCKPLGPLSLRGGGKLESTTIALGWAPRLIPELKLWLHAQPRLRSQIQRLPIGTMKGPWWTTRSSSTSPAATGAQLAVLCLQTGNQRILHHLSCTPKHFNTTVVAESEARYLGGCIDLPSWRLLQWQFQTVGLAQSQIVRQLSRTTRQNPSTIGKYICGYSFRRHFVTWWSMFRCSLVL